MTRSFLRPALGRARRMPITALRRLRRRIVSPAPSVPVQVILDGHSLLNWRSSDPRVEGIVLRGTGGDSELRSDALPEDGPAHGTLTLDRLPVEEHRVKAMIRGRGHAVELIPAGNMTWNEARSRDGRGWRLEASGAAALVPLVAGEEAPGILSLHAAHGMVSLEIGPDAGAWRLCIERRGGGTSLEVPALESRSSDRSAYRLGRVQWSGADVPVDGVTRVWDVVLREGDPAGPRVRPLWRGSAVTRPREALRLRGVISYAVPGRRIEIRPYWTADQHLALEVTGTPNLGGATP